MLMPSNAGVAAGRAPEQLAFDLGAVLFERHGAPVDKVQAYELRSAREAVAPPSPSIASLRGHVADDHRLGLSGDYSHATRGAVEMLLGDLSAHPEEVAAIMGCTAREAKGLCQTLSDRSGFTRRAPTRVADGDADSAVHLVRAALPDGLGFLPDTLLDCDTGQFLGQLDVATVTRVTALTTPVLRMCAMIDAVLLRRFDPSTPTLPIVADWEATDELVAEAAVDIRDPETFGTLMGDYARKLVAPTHPPALRRRVLGRLRALRNNCQQYVAEFPEMAGVLFAAVPPAPILDLGARLAVERFRGEHKVACRRNRKAIARAITGDLDGAIAAAITAVSAARELSNAAGLAERQFRAMARSGHADFGYDCREVGADGRYADGTEKIVLRIQWRRELRALLDGSMQDDLCTAVDCGRRS